ncbi:MULTISPECIES: hypothetical protein [unclassified Agrococcus]|uniref:hypothetical protein n=1 Tax=unclassified Agrococcus TaxID=2615065 RepID=UPI0036171A06
MTQTTSDEWSALEVFLSEQAAAYATADGRANLEAERTHTITAGPERMWAEQRRAFVDADVRRLIAERDGSRAHADAEAARVEQEHADALAEIRRIPAYLNPGGRAQMLADIVHLRHLEQGAA